MKIFKFVVLFFLLTSAAAFAGDSIQEHAYLKDNGRNRIFTFSFPAGATEQQILQHAKQLPNTARRMTVAYYFEKGGVIPADGVTLAGNVFTANRILYETPGLSKWTYAYMVSLKGEQFFIDCGKNPADGLCHP